MSTPLPTKTPTVAPTRSPTTAASSHLHMGVLIMVYAVVVMGLICALILYKKGKVLRKRHLALLKKQRDGQGKSKDAQTSSEKESPVEKDNESMSNGVSHSTAAKWMDYLMFHTTMGRFADVAFLKFQQRLDYVISFFLGGVMTSWMNFQVANSDLPAQAQNTVLLVAFVVFILFSIISDLSTEFIIQHMGGDPSIVSEKYE